MEAMGADVSQKIRSAIKAKLIELGVYIDDELPDYIMVMVANKKTKGQMDDDLHLFLAANTSKFTTWLHEVLERLQSVTSDSVVKKSNQAATAQEMDNYDVQDEILALKAEQEEDDLLAEELALNKPPNDSLPSKERRKQNVVSPVQRAPARATKRSVPAPTAMATATAQPLQKRRAPPSSTVGAVLSRPVESDEEDETNFHSTGIASVVKISARRSSVPPNLQANKNLLMRAVAEAKKSMLEASKNSKNSSEIAEDVAPRPQLFTRKHRAMMMMMPASASTPNAAVVLPRKSTVGVDAGVDAVVVGDAEEEFMQLDDAETKRCIIADNENENKNVVSPTFIVTLDGVDPTTFSSKQMVFKEQRSISESELIDFDEDEYEMLIDSDEVENSDKNSKSTERCKYWPICKNGAECSYQHPSVQCKTFPNCRFGDKCHYIHPNCKYDATCTRQNCPFTHASRRILTQMPPAIVLAPKFRTNSAPKDQQCKFYPKCSNLNCSFYHPKPCRYGLSCTQSGCSFFHPPLPSRDKLKWKSGSSSQTTMVNSG